MELYEILTLLGVIATFFVAFVTFRSLRVLEKHAKIFEKQAVYQRLEAYPIVQIKNVSFKKNSISLELENIGKGPATQLGIRTAIALLKPGPLVKNDDGEIIKDDDGKVQIEYFDFIPSLKDERNRVAFPTDCLNYLKDENGGFNLYPGENKVFTSKEIRLGFRYTKKEFTRDSWRAVSDKGPSYHVPKYNGMRNMLLKNNISMFSLGIYLSYKDFAETKIETESIKDIVVRISEHETLEEAIKENIPFTQRSVGMEEIDYIPGELYKSIKTTRASLEE